MGPISGKTTAPGGGALRPLGSRCRGSTPSLKPEPGNRSRMSFGAAGSVSRNNDDCGDKQYRDQRKRAIQDFRTRSCSGVIEWRHDTTLNVFTYAPGLAVSPPMVDV